MVIPLCMVVETQKVLTKVLLPCCCLWIYCGFMQSAKFCGLIFIYISWTAVYIFKCMSAIQFMVQITSGSSFVCTMQQLLFLRTSEDGLQFFPSFLVCFSFFFLAKSSCTNTLDQLLLVSRNEKYKSQMTQNLWQDQRGHMGCYASKQGTSVMLSRGLLITSAFKQGVLKQGGT